MKTKSTASLVLSVIFVVLIIYGLFVFIGGCFGRGARAGFLEVSGRIEGREYHAGTKVAGRVDELFVKEGDEVEKDQLIAIIYSEQRVAMLAHAEARLKEAESNLALAEVEHKRYAMLLEEAAVPRMEYDYIENNYLVARQAERAARDEVAKRKADLEDTKIISPVTGTVILKIVRKGEVVAVGTPIVTIINMDDLYLKIFLATDVAGKVNLGDEALVYPDALPKQSFDAYVDRIAQKAEFTPKNVETKSQRAKLVFEIKLQIKENPGHVLKPGMPSDGVIKISKKAKWKKYKHR